MNYEYLYKDDYVAASYIYRISYNENGGQNAPRDTTNSKSSSSSGVTVTTRITSDVPERDGYAFISWNTKEDGTGTTYQSGGDRSHSFSRKSSGSYQTTSTNVVGDTTYVIITTHYTAENQFARTTLYAQWETSVVAPTFSVQPSSVSTYVGAQVTLTASATAPYGNISYQWQYSTDNSTWQNVLDGGAGSSIEVQADQKGKTYYRVIATASSDGQSASSTSETATVEANDVSEPIIIRQPRGAVYGIGEIATPMTIIASSNGVLSYRWYKRLSQNPTTWEAITGATSSSYRPSTSSVGTTGYRCEVTATGGEQTKTARSTVAEIVVIEASTPVFVYDLSAIDVTYNAGDVANSLDGTATAQNGTLTYQWQKSTDNGNSWFDLFDATSPLYTPSTSIGGVSLYRVICKNIVGVSQRSATSGIATVRVVNSILPFEGRWAEYLSTLDKPFIKIARLDFLNPNGSVLFAIDNNPRNKKSGAFIQSGDISVNLQNGQRRTATVTLSNLDGEYSYNVNKLWFGQQVRLWEGMILPNGQDFYISQGVFYVKDPEEVFDPGVRQTTLNLVDKWSYLDGTLFGNIDGTYEIPINSNIFNAIKSILNFDRGNGEKIDTSIPIFTNYYNGKTTTLPDGTTFPLTNTPYTYRCDSESGTLADIILELNTMLAGWIGYDSNGQLRLDPSQDDILDTTKPVQWQFSPRNSTFLGATYSIRNSEVYNDIIVIGETLSDYGQTAGRATNYDPQSDTNANLIGLKTKRYQQSGYYTNDICESMAVFKLKRESVLKKSVSIRCSQIFHLQENNLVTIERTDKIGNPIERHLIVGYSRPIAQNGSMTINCTSVNDFPTATITTSD